MCKCFDIYSLLEYLQRELCGTLVNNDYEVCGVTHPGEANGPLKRTTPELFKAIMPNFTAKLSQRLSNCLVKLQ